MKEEVIKFFNEISNFPRSSGNEEKVANYLVKFAKKRNLEVYKDKFNNVLIKKGSTLNCEPIILHSHTDMVCVKEKDYDIDFLVDPIKTVIEGDYLSAYKTSLGADNGLGVAIILSLLDEDNNYNIEALFTTDEEVTMTGALNFDYSLLKGDKLISLDGMSDEELINGCASICDMKIKFNKPFIKTNQKGYLLTVNGLKGGHSGAEISQNIGNSNNILVDILSQLNSLKLSNIEGGNQFNFITNYTSATFVSDDFINKIENIKNKLQNQYNQVKITYKEVEIKEVLSEEFSKKFIDLLTKIKTGVIKGDGKNIVLSQNLAQVSFNKNTIKISQRGHDENEENLNIKKLQELADLNGFDFEIFDKQPGFSALKNSLLTKKLCENYNSLFNKKLKVINKHISLEACIFKQKMPHCDIAIVSPKILDVHSTKERVYIPSIETTCSLLQCFLKNK